jgi:hypothetical protein
MAVLVNPPPQLKIPKQFLKDPETRSFFEQTNVILFQLRNQAVADNEEIGNSSVAESYPWPTSQLLEETKDFNYPTLEQPINKIRTVTVTSNYAALPNDFINAKNNAQITFPKYPDENSVIIVRNGDGSRIKLLGNGKKINGYFDGFIDDETDSIEFHYFIDTDEWFAK